MNTATIEKYLTVMDYHGFIDTIRNGIIECVENIKQTNDPKLKKIYAFVVASDFGNGNV